MRIIPMVRPMVRGLAALLVVGVVAAGCAGDAPAAEALDEVAAEVIVVEPGILDFEEIRVGTNSPSQGSVVSETSATEQTIVGVEARCPDFEITKLIARTETGTDQAEFPMQIYYKEFRGLLTYSELEIYVRFTPQARGQSTCEVTIDMGGLTIDRGIKLAGTGVAPVLELVTSPPSFGNRRINTTSATQPFTIKNSGDAGQNLTLTAPTFQGGTNADDWVVTLDVSTALAAGATRSGTVAFSPKTAGAQPATVIINSNDPQDASETFNLAGTGTTALIGTSVTSLDVGRATVNQTTSQPFSITNTAGTAPLSILATSISGAHSADFSVTAPTTVAAGGSGTVTVQCRPSAVGTRTATLTIDSDADNSPQDPTVNLTCVGEKPDITVTPGSIAFDDTAPGVPTQKTITIANSGAATSTTLSVSAPTISGTNAAEFTVTPGAFTLAPGTNKILTLTFTPTALGSRAASLAIVSNDLETPTVNVPLAGNSVGPEVTLVTPSSGALGFGDVPVSQTSGTQPVTLRNDGNASLSVTAVSLIGSHPGDFVLAGPATPRSIAAAATETWTVACRPTTTGARSATLRLVNTDASEATIDVALTCTGTVGNLVVDSPATPVVFAATDVGLTSAQVVVTLKNSGTAAVTITPPATVTPSQFTISTPLSPTTPFSLAAGATTTLGLRFTPTVDGTVNGTLRINYDATTLQVALTGTGRAALIGVAPTAVDFDDVVVDAFANSSVTVQNTGSDSLAITAATLGGAHPGDFQVVTTPTIVAANGTAPIALRCRPTTVGARTATLTVDSDADNNPQDPVVTLTCRGVKPDVSVSDTSLDFGASEPGTPVQRELVVSNASAATTSTLSVSALTLSGGAAADYEVSPAGAFTLAAGATRTLTITFTPSTRGVRAASLAVVSNDQETPSVAVSLTGSGSAPELAVVQPSPASLPFGDVKVSTVSPPRTLEIRNDGNDPLSVMGVLSTGPDAGQFTVVGPATPAEIDPGESASWQVTCRPSTLGNKTATIQVTSDDADEGTVNLAATCRGTQAILTVTSPATSPVAFATTRVGESSPEVSVVFTNTGTAALDVFGPPVVTPPVFAVTTPFAGEEFSVPANGSVTLGLRFTPIATGDVTGSIDLNWDATSVSVPLSAKGTIAVAEVTPEANADGIVELGAVCVGQPRGQTFTVRNTGTASFRVNALAVDDPVFAVAPLLPATLPATVTPGGTATFTVTADPPVGDVDATITVTTDIPGGTTRTVDVTAVGLATGLGVAPVDGIAFEATDPGASTTAQVVTVTNCEATAMNMTTVAITGADAAEFEVIDGETAPPTFTLAPTESTQWSLAFQPDDVGPATATFHIEHDLPAGGGVIDIVLTGTGGTGPADGGGIGADGGPTDDPDAGSGDNPDAADGPGVDKESYYACSVGDLAGASPVLLALVGLGVVARRRRRCCR